MIHHSAVKQFFYKEPMETVHYDEQYLFCDSSAFMMINQ